MVKLRCVAAQKKNLFWGGGGEGGEVNTGTSCLRWQLHATAAKRLIFSV